MKNLVILTGAGISAESGLKTFRDMEGMWKEYDVYEVASPDGWAKNRSVVLDFYNWRRKQLYEVKPNLAHERIAALEKDFNVKIITQNVDDLHEQAGSTDILHLHGELKKSRSTIDPNLVYDIEGWELKEGDTCEKGSQLRPHIVWFGEAVPAFETATEIVDNADIFVVVGTSLQVYPAAGLMDYTRKDVPIFLVDPGEFNLIKSTHLEIISEKATIGLPILEEKLKKFI